MYMHSSEIPKRFILDDTKKPPFTFKIIPNKISNFIKHKTLIFEEYMRHFFFVKSKGGQKNVDTKNFNFHVLQNCTTRCYALSDIVCYFFFVQICVKILLEL